MNESSKCPVCGVNREHEHKHSFLEFSLGGFLRYISLLTVPLVLGLAFMFLNYEVLAITGFIVVLLVGGGRLVATAVKELIKERAFNIELLVVVAAVGAFAIGEYAEGAVVVYLFNIAVFLEEYASDRVRRDIAALLREKPTKARVLRSVEEVLVDVEEVRPGDVVVVKPGEKIPLDGTVVKGSATVNEAPLTGESVPVEKSPSDRVYAGTICVDGVLFVRVEKKSSETLLARVIELVARARREKSSIERFIEKFSKYYTPVVLSMSAVVALAFPLIFGGDPYSWTYRALILLVISCPCALVISIPVAMVSGIVGSARNGVLVKGGKYLEHLAKVSIIAFDKTGTLTKGELTLSGILPLNVNEEQLLQAAASLSQYSTHPISKVVVEEAEKRGIRLLDVENFKTIPGKGVVAKVGGELYLMGNESLLKEYGIHLPAEYLSKLKQVGTTTAIIASSGGVLGVLGFEDKLRPEAIDVIRELKKRGFKIVMLTGDREEIAEKIAGKLGIDEYFAELLPDDKVDVIEGLMGRHEKHVAMIGDGINDAPALARACVGIAMGTGTEVAIESGDIVLMKPDLKKLPYLTDLSKYTLSVVKQNVTASIMVKLTLALLAILGLVGLWVAVLVGDMGLSLAVIINSLRLSKLH